MARKAGQIVSRGASTWLVRVDLGRDPQTGTRKYHNQTIHGPFREAQRFLNLMLQQRDNGRVSRAAVIRKGHFRPIGTCKHFIHTGTILAPFALNPRRGSGESGAAPDGIDEELGSGRGPKSRTQFRFSKVAHPWIPTG
jgi:hypothetical protein